jgi:hypothetical protein
LFSWSCGGALHCDVDAVEADKMRRGAVCYPLRKFQVVELRGATKLLARVLIEIDVEPKLSGHSYPLQTQSGLLCPASPSGRERLPWGWFEYRECNRGAVDGEADDAPAPPGVRECEPEALQGPTDPILKIKPVRLAPPAPGRTKGAVQADGRAPAPRKTRGCPHTPDGALS